MQNPRLAGRYAKSLIDLALEKGALEDLYADAQTLLAICHSSREFVNLLRSPIVKADKKQAILSQIANGRVGSLTQAFLNLLVNKGREAALPDIMQAVKQGYEDIQGIHHVKLKTAIPVSDALKNELIRKIERETSLSKISLAVEVDEDLVGGFVLEYNNNLVDASVRKYLKDLKAQYSRNDYMMNIR